MVKPKPDPDGAAAPAPGSDAEINAKATKKVAEAIGQPSGFEDSKKPKPPRP